jgi:hypothetical protein
MGFFADAGPLHIFVSNHVRGALLMMLPLAVLHKRCCAVLCCAVLQLIQDDWEFNANGEPCYEVGMHDA